MAMHSAEKLPQERPNIEDKDDERLAKNLEEHDANEEIASIAAGLDQAGDQIRFEGMSDEEKTRAIQERMDFLQHVQQQVKDEVAYLTENRETMQTADEMIDMIVDLSMEHSGMKKDPDAAKDVETYKANASLRSIVKIQLMAAIKAKMKDPSLGNDLEKVSKLEKALDELEK